MENITYPVLTYRLKEDVFLGILVGSDYQVIEKSERQVKDAFSEYLKKTYKKTEDYPYIDLENPKIKMIGVNIRPTYETDTGAIFPVSKQVRVEVPAIYGEIDKNYFECYLPLFGSSFYYYDPRQFKVLAQHFITSQLNEYQPEEVYRLMNFGIPKMDTIKLKVNYNRKRNWRGISIQQNYKNLNRLAERLPYPKSVQKRMSSLPQVAWELDDKVEELVEKMMRQKASVLLVGKNGTGKSAVLQQAIRKIVPSGVQSESARSFWRIMPQRLTASSKYLGEWQETAEALVHELQLANGILWVVDIVQLLQTGGGGPETSVAAYLLTFIRSGKLQLVGEVTPTELESIRRLLPGFAEHFQLIQLVEMPESKIYSILQKLVDYSSKNLKITIQPDALQLGYRLLKRYYPYESFPGKGIKFFSQCINIAQIQGQNLITKNEIIQNFTQTTGLPELFLRDEILLSKEKLHAYFNDFIMGQPLAVEKISNIIQVFKAGLNNPYKPITTLLFAGPTGVGKTATAQALANFFFGQKQGKNPLVRIDMSEYQSPNQLYRFIGHGKNPGALVQAIRERPFSVLLLDEVEKAAPVIFDALLTVLDEGVMTDNFGRQTNFRNTIIIMTSNLGASNRKSLGFQETSSAEARYESAISRFFRPEFVNRIDSVITFNSLSQEDIRKITTKELNDLKKREGFTKRGITLHFTDAVTDYLASVGFDEKYGARPLQRALDQQIMQGLANWLLVHFEIKDVVLSVDWADGKLKIEQK